MKLSESDGSVFDVRDDLYQCAGLFCYEVKEYCSVCTDLFKNKINGYLSKGEQLNPACVRKQKI